MSAAALLTLDQVAERMGISRDGVERLITAGELAAVDVHAAGKRPRLRIREDTLAAFYETRAINTA